MNDLNQSQQQRINNINMVCAGFHLIGFVGGIIYSSRTGGGFWRGFGWAIVGGLVVGVPADLIAVPFKNKILKEADKPAGRLPDKNPNDPFYTGTFDATKFGYNPNAPYNKNTANEYNESVYASLEQLTTAPRN